MKQTEITKDEINYEIWSAKKHLRKKWKCELDRFFDWKLIIDNSGNITLQLPYETVGDKKHWFNIAL